MKTKQFVYGIKGNIVYSKYPEKIEICDNSYLLYEGNKIIGVFSKIPDAYSEIQVKDYGDRLIIPGLVDLHVHAPQYAFRGLGMDLELLDWLNTNTFPEEAKYKDPEYAQKAYRIFG